jgi:hypothetical protein
MHTLRDNQGFLPDYKQLVMTLTGLKKVTGSVIKMVMLGQYQMGRGLPYPPGPLNPAYDRAGLRSWYSRKQRPTRVTG